MALLVPVGRAQTYSASSKRIRAARARTHNWGLEAHIRALSASPTDGNQIHELQIDAHLARHDHPMRFPFCAQFPIPCPVPDLQPNFLLKPQYPISSPSCFSRSSAASTSGGEKCRMLPFPGEISFRCFKERQKYFWRPFKPLSEISPAEVYLANFSPPDLHRRDLGRAGLHQPP